jgi:hypothetical protein
VTITDAVPDNPADPEAAALDLIVRTPGQAPNWDWLAAALVALADQVDAWVTR